MTVGRNWDAVLTNTRNAHGSYHPVLADEVDEDVFDYAQKLLGVDCRMVIPPGGGSAAPGHDGAVRQDSDHLDVAAAHVDPTANLSSTHAVFIQLCSTVSCPDYGRGSASRSW